MGSQKCHRTVTFYSVCLSVQPQVAADSGPSANTAVYFPSSPELLNSVEEELGSVMVMMMSV